LAEAAAIRRRADAADVSAGTSALRRGGMQLDLAADYRFDPIASEVCGARPACSRASREATSRSTGTESRAWNR
jgi:hypothetical protein